MGWIGVDLDGTLAFYDKWQGPMHIGGPIKPMVDRVKKWLDAGRDVRIFTARVCGSDNLGVEAVRFAIRYWCYTNLGEELPITNVKDWEMDELWDDRCVQVLKNTGEPVGTSTRGL